MKRDIPYQILLFLKMNGEANSQQIADAHHITKEGSRKHLLKLVDDGLLQSRLSKEGVGRPISYFSLTEKGFGRFPDSHAMVTVQLLKSIKNKLGENALDLLINDREAQVYSSYAEELESFSKLEEKLTLLAERRTKEGYMAEWKNIDGSYYLIENHCPICAAARECQLFCRSELKNFRQLIGKNYTIERVEYVMENENRCVYKIDPVASPK